MAEKKTTPKPSWKRLLTGVIAISAIAASCWYILRGFQWAEVGKLLVNMDVGCFVLGVLVATIPYWHLRTLRWRLLLRQCGEEVPYRTLHIATVLGVALAPFTPGQLGEVLKIELLNRSKPVSRQAAYSTFVVERILDLAFLMGLGLLAMAAGSFPQLHKIAWLLWIGVAGLALGCVLFWTCRLGGKLGHFQAEMRRSMNDGRSNLAVVLISSLGWLSIACGWQIVLSSIGITISIPDLFGFMASSTVMLIVSFVPAGVGVWEAGGSLLLEATGVSKAEAQAGTLILRLFALGTLILAGMQWGWWRLRYSGR